MRFVFKKLHEDAIIPEYQSAGASGFDLHAFGNTVIEPGETVVIPTKLAVELPKMSHDMLLELQVRPRGGISLKTPLRISNSPGTVDNDYRGEIGIIVTNIDPNKSYFIKHGMRIAQGVVVPIVQGVIVSADILSETKRGDGAYGSTGTN